MVGNVHIRPASLQEVRRSQSLSLLSAEEPPAPLATPGLRYRGGAPPMPPPALGAGFPILRAPSVLFLVYFYVQLRRAIVTRVFLCLVLMLRVRRAVVSMCCCPFVVAPSTRSIAVVQCVAAVRYPHVITFDVVPCVGAPPRPAGGRLLVAVPALALASLALPPVSPSIQHPPGGKGASPPPGTRRRRPCRSGSFRGRPELPPFATSISKPRRLHFRVPHSFRHPDAQSGQRVAVNLMCFRVPRRIHLSELGPETPGIESH